MNPSAEYISFSFGKSKWSSFVPPCSLASFTKCLPIPRYGDPFDSLLCTEMMSPSPATANPALIPFSLYSLAFLSA